MLRSAASKVVWVGRTRALTIGGAVSTALTLCLLVLVAVQPAEAAFPGKNGKIAYNRAFDYWTQKASFGSPEAKLLDDAAHLAYSPDGSRVAFMRSNEIYVANADGTGTPRNLTNSPLLDWSPAWSHDGTRLVFQRRTEALQWHLWSMNADGTGKRQLTNELPTDSAEFEPTWGSYSPDWSAPLPGAPDGLIAFKHQGWLWTMLADGNGKAELSYDCPTENGGHCDTVAADPAFSPDGTEIAAEYHGDIFVVPSVGGASRVLLPGASDTDKRYPGSELDPAWSPDGTKIIFEHNANIGGSPYGIYMANADGSSTQAVQVTAKTGEVDPDWQPNSAPTITRVRPAVDSETPDRTPLISATVSDKQTNLAKANMTLSLDGNAIPRKAFSYDRATDRLSYTPTANLPLGRHNVRIVARDEMGLRATKGWSFKVVR